MTIYNKDVKHTIKWVLILVFHVLILQNLLSSGDTSKSSSDYSIILGKLVMLFSVEIPIYFNRKKLYIAISESAILHCCKSFREDIRKT